MSTSTVQYSSDAGQVPDADILTQAITQELGSLNEAKFPDDEQPPSVQPTHSRETLAEQDLNVDNTRPPAKALIEQDGNWTNKSPPYMKMIAMSILASSGVARGARGGGHLPPGAARRGTPKSCQEIF